MNRKKMISSSSILAAVAIVISGCAGDSTSEPTTTPSNTSTSQSATPTPQATKTSNQTVEEACVIVDKGIDDLNNLATDAGTDEMMAKLTDVQKNVSNTEVKEQWDKIVESTDGIAKLSDELEEKDPEKMSDSEVKEKSDSYIELLETFSTSYDKIGTLCPTIAEKEEEAAREAEENGEISSEAVDLGDTEVSEN